MECPARIGPCIFSIVEVAHASFVTLSQANIPIIAAEFKRSGRCKLRRTNAFHNCYESNGTALVRSYIHLGQRVIVWVHQQRSILKSQMSLRAPRRVCFDGNEGTIGLGLHPPLPAVRINNNLLFWSSVPYPSRDRVNSFFSTLRRRRNMGEVDRGARA